MGRHSRFVQYCSQQVEMRMADFDQFGGDSVADYAGQENCDFHNASFLCLLGHRARESPGKPRHKSKCGAMISRGGISTFSIGGRPMARDILERFMDALSCIDQGRCCVSQNTCRKRFGCVRE